jgi:hypothetical protein
LAAAAILAFAHVGAEILPRVMAPGAAHAGSASQMQCPDNVLVNPGFEAGFMGRGRVSEVVANGWTAWYERFPGVNGINYVPDYVPRNRHDGGRNTVHTGVWSQEMATSGATHTAGLWQRVTVPSGSHVLAAGAAYAWATNGDDPQRSDAPGTYALTLGLDPRGGEDPNAPSIVWTVPVTVTDAWAPLVVEAPVRGSSVTLFTRGQPLRQLAHNVSRWDSLCLRVLGPIGEPTATSTRLPWPSRTPRPEDHAEAHTPTVTAAPGTQVALELGLKLDLLAESTAAAADAPTEPALSLPERVATRAAQDAPSPLPTPWPEEEDEATILEFGSGIVESLGLVVLALAALVAGLVVGLGRRRRPSGDGSGGPGDEASGGPSADAGDEVDGGPDVGVGGPGDEASDEADSGPAVGIGGPGDDAGHEASSGPDAGSEGE